MGRDCHQTYQTAFFPYPTPPHSRSRSRSSKRPSSPRLRPAPAAIMIKMKPHPPKYLQDRIYDWDLRNTPTKPYFWIDLLSPAEKSNLPDEPLPMIRSSTDMEAYFVKHLEPRISKSLQERPLAGAELFSYIDRLAGQLFSRHERQWELFRVVVEKLKVEFQHRCSETLIDPSQKLYPQNPPQHLQHPHQISQLHARHPIQHQPPAAHSQPIHAVLQASPVEQHPAHRPHFQQHAIPYPHLHAPPPPPLQAPQAPPSVMSPSQVQPKQSPPLQHLPHRAPLVTTAGGNARPEMYRNRGGDLQAHGYQPLHHPGRVYQQAMR